MKIRIETNIIDWIRAQKRTLAVLAVEILAVTAFVGAAWVWGAFQPVIRDFYISNYAHVRAGEAIPFTEDIAEWTGGFKIDAENIYTFGMESNSIWVANYTRKIVPYMNYEKLIANGFYPVAANVVPFPDTDSFHVAGRMIPSDSFIFLNERYFLDGKWNDQRKALETLVHELVHIQRGAFINGDSASLESATSAATTEVLAAMCNYKDELACKAFWLEIESLARSSLLVQLNAYGVQNLYESWADTFWRDDVEIGSYRKAMRFWAESPGSLMAIRVKYAIKPWVSVIYGTAYGIPLDTGNPICTASDVSVVYDNEPMYKCNVIGMPFDDTWYLLQDLMWLMK